MLGDIGIDETRTSILQYWSGGVVLLDGLV